MAQTLSIVVPTRNRAAQIGACAAAILDCADFDELLFVDQSDGPETATAVAAIGDERVRCVRSSLRGACNGRNTGIDETRGELLAFTDDDCRPKRDWARNLRQIFSSDPGASVVCGRVSVPEELASKGFVTGFEPHVREWQGRLPPADRDWGLTANLAVRRTVIHDVGKFDPMLGVGAPLVAGEEPDFLIRVLAHGYKVVNASEVEVVHYGLREHGEQASKLWRAYGMGTAAAVFKHVRLGDRAARALYLEHFDIMGRLMLESLIKGERPKGLAYTLALISGTIRSLRFGVNSQSRLYEPRRLRSSR